MSLTQLFQRGRLVAVPLVLPMAGAIARFTHFGCGGQRPSNSPLKQPVLLMSGGLRP